MAGSTRRSRPRSSACSFPQLRGGPCRAYDADLRVRTRSGLATYPDVTVVRGSTERDDVDRQAVMNPTLIVEVPSRSTEEYNEGDKFEHYKTLPSLRQYVLVSHRERSVDVWTREETRWERVVVREGSIADLTIGARLDVRELYVAAAE